MNVTRKPLAQKYIVMKKEDGTEYALVFPTETTHADFLDGILQVPHGYWKTAGKKYAERFDLCIAGGFFNGVECHGASESIGVKSRGEVDTALILGPIV